MDVLTGHPNVQYRISESTSPDKIWNILTDSLAKKYIITGRPKHGTFTEFKESIGM